MDRTLQQILQLLIEQVKELEALRAENDTLKKTMLKKESETK